MAFHEHFQIDAKTGFLTPKPTSKLKNGFTAQQKVEWLKAFESTFNFSKASKMVGVSNPTVRDHLKGDDKFSQAYTEAKDAVCDSCQEALFAFIHKNPTAAFGILKAFRPAIWREKHTPPGPTKDDKLNQLFGLMKKEDENGKE